MNWRQTLVLQQRFTGKVAFITGGATGLGRDFARALSREGAAVALADVDIRSAQSTAAELNTGDLPVVAIACDVAVQQSVEQAVESVTDQLGGVDVLINNAALHMKKYNGPFSSLSNQEIRGLFDVNVMGIIQCSLACRTSMQARGGGAILNMSSLAGFTTQSPYGVSKLAVRGLTIAFATEFAPDGIRVNAIAPTLTPTENVLAEFTDEDFERSVETRQLVRRRATMDDVTRTMLFLCSEDSSFITGETIRVTGGGALAV
jgi:NAD(P)-dependent dehydrogenase (short-subunit alcohol dehydrogenase family)